MEAILGIDSGGTGLQNKQTVVSNRKSKEDVARYIMNAALSLFAEMEVHEVTMKEIARKAGIGIGSIYRLFPGKEELLLAITEDKAKEMTTGLQEHLQGIVGTKNKLRKYTWFILHFFESNPEFTSVMFMAIPLRTWARVLASASSENPFTEQGQMLAEIVKEGEMAGEVRPDINVRQLTDSYFGGLQRLTSHWLALGKPYKLSDAADEFTMLFFEGIKKQTDERAPFKCPLMEEQERK